MNQPDEQAHNEEQFKELLRTFDPQLYLLYEAMNMTSLNWEILREVIAAIHDVSFNNGSGEAKVFVLNGTVKSVQGTKNRLLNLPAIIEETIEKEYTIDKAD